MPLKPDKITFHRSNLAKADDPKKAISYVATLDAEITVPVLIQVLSELKLRILPEDVKTLAAIDEAINVFERADYYQNINILSLTTKLEEVKTLIKSGLDSLLEKVQEVTVTTADLVMWNEIWFLLEGLHQRVFVQIKKDKNGAPLKEDGQYVTIDIADKIFRKVTGITKYDIALYYHRTGEMVLEKIQACKAASKEQPNDHHHVTVKEEGADSTTFQVQVPKALQERFQALCDAFLKDPNSVHVMNGDALGQGLTGADFLSVLSVVDAQDEQVKIKTLHAYYQKNGLTLSQAEMLAMLKQDIESALKSYLNTPTYTSYLFQKTHAVLVQEILTQLELSDKPSDHLNQLFDMRQQLIGDNSGILLPKVNRLLLDVFSMLSSQAKVEQEKNLSERSTQGVHHVKK